MKRASKQNKKESRDSTQKGALNRAEQSPVMSRYSEESTSCMFSGKKRRRTDSKSAPKQRYLKTSGPSRIDFDLYHHVDPPKTKKQYWTEEEVSISFF